ncbi:MAG: GAF domain-containing protein [Candidatus Zixiibacteriota bacterium]
MTAARSTKPSIASEEQPLSTGARTRHINALGEIAELCLHEPPSSKMYASLLRLVKEIIPCDAASLFLFNSRTNELEETASVGGTVHPLDFLELSIGKGLTSWTATNLKPVVLLDRSGSRHFDPVHDFASFISVPIFDGATPFGVLNLGARTGNGLAQDDVVTAQAVARNLLLGIERQRLAKSVDTLEKQMAALKSHIETMKRSDEISGNVGEFVHQLTSAHNEINNALEVIVGNIECLVLEKVAGNQKTLSRLKRSEQAAIRISHANQVLLTLEQYLGSIGKPSHRDD